MKKRFGPAEASAGLPLLLGIYIVAQPLLDVLTNLGISWGMGVTVGAVVRMLVLAAAFLWILCGKPFGKKRLCVAGLGVCAAYVLAFLAVMYAAGGAELCLSNLKETAKMLYYPVMGIFLFAAWQACGARISDRALAAAGGIYAFVILLACVTGTSGSTYHTGFGYKGWFYAANEVSCNLAIVCPVTVWAALERLNGRSGKRAVALSVLALASVAFSASYLGTKIVFAVLAVYTGAAFVWCLVRTLRRRGGLTATVASGLLLAAMALLFLTSPLNDYLGSVYFTRIRMNTEDVAQMWEDAPETPEYNTGTGVSETFSAASAASEGTWLREKIAVSPFLQKVDQIFSRRLLSAAPAVQVFLESPLSRKLLGIGYATAPCYSREVNYMIEIDGLSLLVRHGILGFALFFLPYAALVFLRILRFFRRPAVVLGSLRACSFLFAALAAFAISVFAGHVLTAPAVSIFMLAVTLYPPDRAPEQN